MSQDHGEQNVSEFYVYVIHHLAAANRARAGQPFLLYAVRTSMGHRGWPMQPARGLSGMIPVEITQTPWHFTTWPNALDRWQTGVSARQSIAAAAGQGRAEFQGAGN
jgi:hypothetical protein